MNPYNDFLDIILKAQETKAKINKWDYIENFLQRKINDQKKWKVNLICEEILENYTKNTGLFIHNK